MELLLHSFTKKRNRTSQGNIEPANARLTAVKARKDRTALEPNGEVQIHG